MTFTVRELRSARADKRAIVEWLKERSPRGANSWLRSYDQMIARLAETAENLPEAQENADLDMDVRQSLFKSRRGRIYRALFIIEGNEAFILRVRGPGQSPVDASQLND
jgi:plasmid stabilization system protein ParE